MRFCQNYMIVKIKDPSEFDSFDEINLFSVRIKSLLSAYKTEYDFASFYKQIDDDDNVTAIISKLDGNVTVSRKNSDNDELAQFFGATGYSTVLTDTDLKLGGEFDEGVIMVSDKKAEYRLPFVFIDEYPKLMDLYNFQDYSSINFESWYVDVCHRIRHGCAKAYTVNVNGLIASSAIFSSIYNGSAVLSSVQTAPEFRRMGYGRALVSHMISDVTGSVFLMRDADKNERFYMKSGFKNCGKWRMYK